MKKNMRVLCVMAVIVMMAWRSMAGAQEAKNEKNNVLARVGDVEIKEQNVDDIINSLDPQQRMYYENEQGRKAILDELINLEVFARWAKDNNLEKDPVFMERLENIKRELLRQTAVEKMLSKAAVTEKEAKDYYAVHLTEFNIPAQMRASHILVASEEEAKKIREEIETKKLSFEEAVEKYSTCPSKQQKGDLGYFQGDQVVPEFSKATEALKKGEISAPVQSQFGWHIIRLEDKKPASLKSFEDVKGQIEANILKDKRSKIYLEETERLRKEYKVEIIEKK